MIVKILTGCCFRLLNYDVDKWVHLNCALWSDEVYETVNGALMNVETVLQQSLGAICVLCKRTGATLKCYKLRCSVTYHLPCAVKDECVFYKNKVSFVVVAKLAKLNSFQIYTEL